MKVAGCWFVTNGALAMCIEVGLVDEMQVYLASSGRGKRDIVVGEDMRLRHQLLVTHRELR